MGTTRQIAPGTRTGTAAVPASKSRAHRLLIMAALSEAPSVLECYGFSNDILATIGCLNALGCDIRTENDHLIHVNPLKAGSTDIRTTAPASVSKTDGRIPDIINTSDDIPAGIPLLPCRDSGSTLRFLLPLAGALGTKCSFKMEGRLPERPLAPYDAELEAHGMKLTRSDDYGYSEASHSADADKSLLYCDGQLKPGNYTLPGNVSSQYISGLLMSLPILEGDSTLTITGSIESSDYIRMTEDALKLAGIRFSCDNGEGTVIYRIPGNQSYHIPERISVEGDWSGAAFFLCLGALSPDGVTVRGLNTASLQGDKAIIDILRDFGADITISREASGSEASDPQNNIETGVQTDPQDTTETGRLTDPQNTTETGRLTDSQDTTETGGQTDQQSSVLSDITVKYAPLHACTIDAAGIPDLIPVVSVIAAAASGTTHIINAGRLRLKESDRLKTTAEMLTALGAEVIEGEDSLTITGCGIDLRNQGPLLPGGTVDSHNDHRIAMSAAVASAICSGPVTVSDPDCVKKSFADFWDIFDNLRRTI